MVDAPFDSPEMQALHKWYWARFTKQTELPPLPEFDGFPVARNEEGWPILKSDIDQIGPSWVMVGPMSEDEAWAVSIKTGGRAMKELPWNRCHFHTDG